MQVNKARTKVVTMEYIGHTRKQAIFLNANVFYSVTIGCKMS